MAQVAVVEISKVWDRLYKMTSTLHWRKGSTTGCEARRTIGGTVRGALETKGGYGNSAIFPISIWGYMRLTLMGHRVATAACEAWARIEQQKLVCTYCTVHVGKKHDDQS
jgi:hypothetical protein